MRSLYIGILFYRRAETPSSARPSQENSVTETNTIRNDQGKQLLDFLQPLIEASSKHILIKLTKEHLQTIKDGFTCVICKGMWTYAESN